MRRSPSRRVRGARGGARTRAPDLRRAMRGALLAAAACAGLAAAAPASAEDAPARPGPRPMPMVDRRAPRAARPRTHLEYFGGRVVSNVQVVSVLWGSGRYAPWITDPGSPSMSSFLRELVGGPFLDVLGQYDTRRVAVDGSHGTDQDVGRGTFAAQVRISPSPPAAGFRIDDATIRAELAAQLTAGTLPPPATDAAGNPITAYLLHLPAGHEATLGSDATCSTMCAYHGALDWKGVGVYYVVLPDTSPGSGCDVGCGGDSPFATATSVAAHELAELVTDPEVAFASGLSAPVAWYDPANGEVGDVCDGALGTIAGGDGASYSVQRVWSNADAACVAAPGPGLAVAAADAPAAATGGAPGGALLRAAQRVVPAAPAAPAPAAASAAAPAPAVCPAVASVPVPLAVARPRLDTRESEPSDLPQGVASGFTVEEENDGFAPFGHRTDDFYTQGLRISSRWASRTPLAPEGRELLGFAIGQNMYTPSDIRTTDLATLRQDRPYAGWLYGAILWDLFLDRAPFSLRGGVDADGHGASAIGVEVAFGTTGPRSAAGAVQTSFHGLLRDLSGSPTSPPDPAGWSIYQTANRLTADVALRAQFDVVQASAALGGATSATGAMLGFRLSPRARIDAGTMFDAASLGLESRLGLVAAPRRIAQRPALPLQLYAFARADGRYVAYNGFVEAPLRNGVTTLVRVAPWVGDLDVGVAARVGGLELGLAELWRTAEITGGLPATRGVHRVGQARISFVY